MKVYDWDEGHVDVAARRAVSDTSSSALDGGGGGGGGGGRGGGARRTRVRARAIERLSLVDETQASTSKFGLAIAENIFRSVVDEAGDDANVSDANVSDANVSDASGAAGRDAPCHTTATVKPPPSNRAVSRASQTSQTSQVSFNISV